MDSYNYLGELLQASPPYYGKKWTLFGASDTDEYGGHDKDLYDGTARYPSTDSRCWRGYKFASRVARELNLTIDNRAHSGSNIYYNTGSYGSVNGITVLDAFLVEIEAGTTECPDYITIAFGGNQSATAIGTDDDTSEVTTSTYGAMKYYIEHLLALQQVNPELVFGFIMPYKMGWTDTGHDVDGGRAAMIAVCEEYGIPYIDLSKESGIQASELPDGVHCSDVVTNTKVYHAVRRFVMNL